MGKEHRGVPLDRGWSWMILGGCMSILLIHVGSMKAFGIFFLEILDIYKTSVSMTSLITAMQTLAYILTSIPVLSIGLQFFSSRQLCLVGAVLCVCGFALSCLEINFAFLIFSLSLLVGTGAGLMIPPLLVVLGKYFQKRRGFANGLTMAGGCLGGLTFPVVFRYMLDTYGFKGAMLLTGGCYAHILVGASLLRPPSFYLRNVQSNVNENKKETNKTNGNKTTMAETTFTCKSDIHVHTEKQAIVKSLSSTGKVDIVNANTEEMTELLVSSMPNISKISPSIGRRNIVDKRSRTLSESVGDYPDAVESKLKISQYLSNYSLMCLSTADITWNREETEDNQSGAKNKNVFKRCILFIRQLKILDFTILRQFEFVLYLFAVSFGTVSGGLMHIFLPAYAKEKDISKNNIVLLVTILGACDFIGRVTSGIIVDHTNIPIPYVTVVSQIVMTILSNCARFCGSFWSFCLFSVISGIFGGTPIALCPAAITKVVGIEKFPGGLAFLIMSQGATFGAVAPLLGYFRDATGTYYVTFHYMGVSAFISVILYLVQPVVQRLDKKRGVYHSP